MKINDLIGFLKKKGQGILDSTNIDERIGGAFSSKQPMLSPQPLKTPNATAYQTKPLSLGQKFWMSGAGQTLAGQKSIPRLNLTESKPVQSIQNPIARFAVQAPLSVAESFANIPSNLAQGVVNTGSYMGQVAHGSQPLSAYKLGANVAPFAVGMLDLGTAGLGGTGLAKQGLKVVGKQTLKNAVKKGAITGAGYGGVQSFLTELGNQREKQDVAKLGTATYTGIAGGALLGGAMGGAGKLLNEKLLRIVTKNEPKISPQEAQNKVNRFIQDTVTGKMKGSVKIKKEPVYYGDMRESLGLSRNGDVKMGFSVQNISGKSLKEIEEAKNLDPLIAEASTYRKQLNEISQRANLTSSEAGIAKLGADRSRIQSLLTDTEEKINALSNKKMASGLTLAEENLPALGFKLKTPNGEIVTPIKEIGKDNSGTLQYLVIDSKGKQKIVYGKNPNYSIDPNGSTAIRDHTQNGKNIGTVISDIYNQATKGVKTPEQLTKDMANTARSYGVNQVMGEDDKALAQWTVDQILSGGKNVNEHLKVVSKAGKPVPISSMYGKSANKGATQSKLTPEVKSVYDSVKVSEYFSNNRNIAQTLLELDNYKNTPTYKALDILRKERGIKDIYSELVKPQLKTAPGIRSNTVKESGFTNEMSNLNAGKTTKTLEAKIRYEGRVMKKSEYVQELLKNGYTPDNTLNRLVKNDRFYDVSKTEADYARHLSANQSGLTPEVTTTPSVRIQEPNNQLVRIAKPQTLVSQPPLTPPSNSIKTSSPASIQPSSPGGSLQTPPPGGIEIPPRSDMNSGQSGTTQKYSYNFLDKLYSEFVDRFNPMSRLAKVAGKEKQLRGRLAQYYGSGSTADYHLQEELSPILKDTDVNDLKEAAIAMRDIELQSRGITGSPNQANSQASLEALKAKYGEGGMKALGEKLQQLYSYQDKIAREYLVDTGIMSEKAYNAMRSDNNFYIPFKRVSDKVDEFLGIPVKRGAGSVGSQNVIYKIKGSDKEILDPIESIVENTYKMVSLGQRQRVARVIAGISNDLPDLVKKVSSKTKGTNTIDLFENGKKVSYEVPEEVADAARGMSEESLVTLVKILKLPTDMFRTMTTGINPEFLLPNVSRDVQSAMFNAGLNPLKWIAGLAHYAKGDEVYKEFLKSGGRTSRVSINRPYLKQTAEEIAGKSFVVRKPSDVVRGLEMLSQYSEQPTRIAVFKDALNNALKSGMSEEEAMREAAYWAQEGTVNFARRGSKMTNINAIYAYLNARVQGVDRMVRSAKADPGKTAARFGFGMLAPSLALYTWNSSNPKYYDERILSERDKQDNFIFMLPKPINGVEYLKIPKSEVAKVVNPVEEFLDFAKGRDSNVAGTLTNVLKSFSPIDNAGGIIPTAVGPIVENTVNKDFYTGYDIVPDYKKNLPPAYQDSPYTSPLFRVIGQKTNQSPAKLQNLAESYGGGLVRIAEMGSQPFINDEYKSSKNEQGAPINRTPVLRRFMGGEKKSLEEQQKSNESKITSLNYDISDVKSAIRRGDITPEVGQKQIEKLQAEQSKLLGGGTISGKSWVKDSTGKLREVDMGELEIQNIETEYSLEADRLKRSDDSKGWIELTTGYIDYLKEAQKKLDSTYDKPEINRIQNKIEDLEEQVSKYKGYGGFKKGKKPKSTTKKLSIKATSTPKVKLSPINIPSYKVKLSGTKSSPVKLTPLTKSSGISRVSTSERPKSRISYQPIKVKFG